MKMRKAVIGTLALLLAVGTISFNGVVYAEEPEAAATKNAPAESENETEAVPAAEEISGDGWELDEAGVFTLLKDITYTGQTYEWEQYAEQIKEIRVAEGVTEIPNMAFSSKKAEGVKYSNLQKVTLSSTVKKIYLGAFGANPGLTEVYLNDGLEYIENVAFQGAGISDIKLPENVEICSDVFYGCNNLKSVTIPSGTTWGGGNAQFSHCHNLTTAIVEEGVTTLAVSMFLDCPNLKYLKLPKSIEEIPLGYLAVDHLCVVGYKGSGAEKYVNGPTGQYRKMTFHAIDGDEHTGEWTTITKPTCTENGTRELVCTTPLCGATKTEVLAATGHQWDSGKVTQAATEKAEGVKTYTCTVCGTTKTEAIAKLVPSGNGNTDKANADQQDVSASNSVNAPKTGDTANIWTWALLMTASAGAITVFLMKKRTFR